VFQVAQRTGKDGGTTHSPCYDDANPLGVIGCDGCGVDTWRCGASSGARRGDVGYAGCEGGGCRRFWCGARCKFGARRCKADCAGVLRVSD